ncbi:MAG: hypothetical protein Q8Q56_03040 [Alphaproteobacteria bacterium]|nr:hypothetical protein [Alphaproteobacteria bacterium]
MTSYTDIVFEEGQDQLKRFSGEIQEQLRRLKTSQETIKRNLPTIVDPVVSVAPLEDEAIQQLELVRNNLKRRRLQEQLKESISEHCRLHCHSEQALRLHLWLTITDRLSSIQTDLIGGSLFLNIHTERDPCRICTHCLLLELNVHDRNPRARQGRFDKRTKTTIYEAHGFFQKLNFSAHPKHSGTEGTFPHAAIPSSYILVSSQKPESDGGLRRRLTSGRDYPADATMDTAIPLASPVRLYFRYNGPFPVGVAAAEVESAGEEG